MFNIRKEGEIVRYGFNFYPLSDKSSIGFVLKYWKGRALFVRYSKRARKVFICNSILVGI